MSSLISVTVHTKYAFPEDRELIGVNTTVRELTARNAGKLVSRDQGMGQINFAYEVEHEGFARAKIGLLLGKNLPGNKYTVNVKTLDASMHFEGITDRRRSEDRRAASDRRSQQPLQQDFGQRDIGLGL